MKKINKSYIWWRIIFLVMMVAVIIRMLSIVSLEAKVSSIFTILWVLVIVNCVSEINKELKK